jgi:2-keto-3-deoxy-L-rhamnonate aldolase RhmA
MRLHNPVKEKLRGGGVSIGSWCLSGNPLTAEVVAAAGFEWVMLDVEHFPVDVEAAANCFRGIQLAGAMPFARLPAADAVWIKRFADAGAMGLVVPLVRSADEVRRVAEWSRFPPRGRRPYGGGRVHFLYGREQYLAGANDALLVLVQIETPEAVEDLDAILAVEGVDGCFVGPTDLSLSLGFPLPGAPSEEREQLVRDLAARISAAGKIAATVSSSPRHAAQRVAEGYRMLSVLGDLPFARGGADEAVAELRRRGLL